MTAELAIQTPADLTDTWPTEHMSALALLQPDRIRICAEHQLALTDEQATEATAHLTAARRHLQAAMRAAPGLADRAYGLPKVCERLDRLAQGER